MSRRVAVVVACAFAVLSLAGPVRAAGYGTYGSYGSSASAPTSDEWPTELVLRPLTLARGMFEIAAPFGLDVSPGGGERLASVPLAVHAGLTDWLTAGIRHARGFCAAGAGGGCGGAYDDVRADALAQFYGSRLLDAAYGVAFGASSLADAVAFSADARLVLRVARDPFAVVFAPEYGFGLSRRDTASRIVPATFPLAGSLEVGTFGTFPNRETVHLPLVAEIQAQPDRGVSRVALAAAIAFDGVLDPLAGSVADSYRVPVAFALVATPARVLDVGASFAFPNLLGKSDGVRLRSDERVVGIFVALRPSSGAPRAPVIAPVAHAAQPVPRAASNATAVAAAPYPPVAATATATAAVPPPAPVPAVARVAEPGRAAMPYAIIIQNFTYAPLSLEVPPGATIAVHNADDVPHSVTSESAPGELVPGAVAGVAFDTGAFTGDAAFTIPPDAQPGTVIPYYCIVHKGAMTTPDGEIRIVAPR